MEKRKLFLATSLIMLCLLAVTGAFALWSRERDDAEFGEKALTAEEQENLYLRRYPRVKTQPGSMELAMESFPMPDNPLSFKNDHVGPPLSIFGPRREIVPWHETGAPVSVPVPGTVWLLGSALVGLAGLRKKFRK